MSDLQPVLADGLRMVLDLVVGCIFIGAVAALSLVPARPGTALKAIGWAVLNVVFQVGLSAVTYCIERWEVAGKSWERAVDRFWRIRCWMTGKHVRPY